MKNIFFNQVSNMADTRLLEIKAWTLARPFPYVEVPEESIDNIYRLLIKNKPTHATTALENFYYGCYYLYHGYQDRSVEHLQNSVDHNFRPAYIQLLRAYEYYRHKDLAISVARDGADKNILECINYLCDNLRDDEEVKKYAIQALNLGHIGVLYRWIQRKLELDPETAVRCYVEYAEKFESCHFAGNIPQKIKLIADYKPHLYVILLEKLPREFFEKIFSNNKLILFIGNLYHSKINLIKLHFDYSMEGKGFEEAKRDFGEQISSLNRT